MTRVLFHHRENPTTVIPAKAGIQKGRGAVRGPLYRGLLLTGTQRVSDNGPAGHVPLSPTAEVAER